MNHLLMLMFMLTSSEISLFTLPQTVILISIENWSIGIIKPLIKFCYILFFSQCVWLVLMMMEATVFFVRKEPTMGNSIRHPANHVEPTRQQVELVQHLVMSVVSTNQTTSKARMTSSDECG